MTTKLLVNYRAFGIFIYVPRKIRQLVSDLEGAGFMRVQGGKGSHRNALRQVEL
ncbi:MAG: hypothetical protein M3Y82_13820 [Verrucomicrobiota bacterium]|nr:hypothetical protein [Verrucomicrobiota bacterium]